uniref:Uncharacterized protein n=1 Tax=Triticum urartu TaxID=4572 RepID=A0A8R7QPS4_TRIUA
MEPPRTGLKSGSCDDLENGRRKMMEEYEAGLAGLLELEALEREMRELVPAATSAIALLATPRVGDTRETYCHVCHDDFEEGGQAEGDAMRPLFPSALYLQGAQC